MPLSKPCETPLIQRVWKVACAYADVARERRAASDVKEVFI